MHLIQALSTALACIGLAAPLSTLAHEEHQSDVSAHTSAGAHGSQAGMPGVARNAVRTITVSMGDDMRFSPSVLAVKRGETVRVAIANAGKLTHEFVLGTAGDLRAHAQEMRAMPGMQHQDANMVRVDPGQQGELVWQFTTTGEVPFACLVPGHFEAGMAGKVVVQ